MNKIDEILKEFKETTIPFETCYSGTGNREVIEDSLLTSKLYRLTKQQILKAITEDERWPKEMIPVNNDGEDGFNNSCHWHKSALAEILEIKE